MKIIKHGNLVYINSNDFKLECTNCGCIFLCNAGDFIKQEKKLGGYAWVRCPDCNRELQFKPCEYIYEEELENE